VAHDSIKISKDKYNRVVAEKMSYEVTNKQLKGVSDSLKNVIKGYKPTVVIKYKTKIVYKDTIQIKYDTILPEPFDIPFRYDTKWLAMSGRSKNTGLDINKIIIPNEQSVVVGKKRDGFLNPSYSSIKIVNTNPYINSSSIDSYTIKRNKTIFEKWYFWLGAGVIGGLIIK
jgi:hypothetical protein